MTETEETAIDPVLERVNTGIEAFDDLVMGDSASEQHISTLTDSIILLRYIQEAGFMHRGLMVLKMRSGEHDKQIRRFTIDSAGMHLGQPFGGARDVFGGDSMGDQSAT